MTITKFLADKEREAREVFRTTDQAHPGVARLYRHGRFLLGGEVFMLNGPKEIEFPELRHEPAQTRRMFASRGWRRIVAFQTRNPIHRAHEYIQKTALEIVDGLFLHPLVGETKPRINPSFIQRQKGRILGMAPAPCWVREIAERNGTITQKGQPRFELPNQQTVPC